MYVPQLNDNPGACLCGGYGHREDLTLPCSCHPTLAADVPPNVANEPRGIASARLAGYAALRACPRNDCNRPTAVVRGNATSFENCNCYSITRFARNINSCGIASPSLLAVARLTTSSKIVGCSTGSSFGLAPFRILSTYVAARRKNTA